MTIINELELALNYMETNLLEPINYKDVANNVYLSSYHFHRSFSLIAGISPTEYIKNRRLSLAGQEIVGSKLKVIDLSLKYCYETPESFSKAFTRFHGISPSIARKTGSKLKIYSPLRIKLSLEGGNGLEYRIEETIPFTLITKKKTFDNTIIADENNCEIPDFWKECESEGVFNKLKEYSTEHDIYGVCAPISKESSTFSYGIGMKYDSRELPTEFELWQVKPTFWAVFKCIGEDTECISETWSKIFSEFLPTGKYSMLDDNDFELYSENFDSDCFCEIWIPIKKN
ncbi:AraC family transcriptional regulator [Vagococcus fluvialis]|uniref:AraC family transcriptional regulator n=1 Tax=Vagococcus fluvialis TaxID=2738 RepID=UPI0037B85EF8